MSLLGRPKRNATEPSVTSDELATALLEKARKEAGKYAAGAYITIDVNLSGTEITPPHFVVSLMSQASAYGFMFAGLPAGSVVLKKIN